MSIWVRNEATGKDKPRPAWQTDYTISDGATGPRSLVLKLVGPSQGSGILIAPNLVLTASHVVKPGKGNQWTATSGSQSFRGTSDLQLRQYDSAGATFKTKDLALVKIADTGVPKSALFGLMSFSQDLGDSSRAALGSTAVTAGFPGNLYSTQQAAIDGDLTKLVDGPMYEMSVNINTSAREGWETANVGAAGHSGGGVWIDYTDPDGNMTQKIIGDYTFANASGLNGANQNSQTYRGVGGNLLTNLDKENIDAYLKSQGYKAGQLPTDVIHGSDGNDRFALDSTDSNAPAALSGSFKNEIIYGNGGDDIIYTGARPSDVDGETPSGDTISGGAGADTIVFGPGTHRIVSESAADRVSDRLAVLVDSVDADATAEGATPDLDADRLLVLGGGASLSENDVAAYQYISRLATPGGEFAYRELTRPAYADDVFVVVNIVKLDVNGQYDYSFDRDLANNYVGNIAVDIYAFKPDLLRSDLRYAFAPVTPAYWTAAKYVWKAHVTISDFHTGDFGLQFLQSYQGPVQHSLSDVAGYNEAITALSIPVETVDNIDGVQLPTVPFNGSPDDDDITGTAGPDNAAGLGGNDRIATLDGNDILDGGTGTDTMTGGAGNDLYIVDTAGDTVIEVFGAGTDRIATSVSYTLAAGQSVETLAPVSYSSSADTSLTGNALAQSIFGTAGNNVISDGGVGAPDAMSGLAGNDLYIVNNAGDLVTEIANAGIDRIAASVSYTLGAGLSVETLAPTSYSTTTSIALTGNDLVQTVIGNAGANVVDGKSGNDTLSGLGGADTFVFDTALTAAANVDRITDFAVGADVIQLAQAIFSTLAAGTVSGNAFYTGAAAHDADDRIVYNATSGALSYDADGNAAGGATQFATLSAGLALSAGDFKVM